MNNNTNTARRFISIQTSAADVAEHIGQRESDFANSLAAGTDWIGSESPMPFTYSRCVLGLLWVRGPAAVMETTFGYARTDVQPARHVMPAW